LGFELLSLRWTKRLESWWCSIMLGRVCVDWLENVVAEAVKCLGCMQQGMAHCCFLMTMCNSLNLSVSTDHYPCLLAFNCFLSLDVLFFTKFFRLNKCLRLCKYFNSNLVSDLNVSYIPELRWISFFNICPATFPGMNQRTCHNLTIFASATFYLHVVLQT
jgi:hypothetical protein